MKSFFTKTALSILISLCICSYAFSLVSSEMTRSTEFNSLNIILNNNILKAQESDWVNIFNGNNMDGWHLYNSNKSIGWLVEDGIMFSTGGNGDIVTDLEFENFELEVEWKINRGGNSGIFYYVQEDKQYAKMWQTGPEFQIIDDVNYPADLLEKQKTGSCSDVLPPIKLTSHAVGEWNYTRIIVVKGKVQHWLNGELVLKYSMNSKSWKKAVKKSKFADFDYAKIRKGKIGLQDHGQAIFYKKVRIRKL